MLVSAPGVDIQSAALQSVTVGQLAIGPITVRELILNDMNFSMSAAQGVLRNMRVTLTPRIRVEWHVHVGLPDGIPDIDVGRTEDLGSISFGLAVGDIVLPGLNNLRFDIPTLTAHDVSISASPLSLELNNVAAEQIQATNATLPAAGFSISGLGLTSLQGNGINVPDARVDQVAIGHLHSDPAAIPSLTLSSLSLPAAQIPQISSSAPLDIPATLQGPSPGFDIGVLRVVLHLIPSVLSHIEQLEITGATANAQVGQVVLRNVTLPYDVLNLTLSQVGIDTVEIPTFTVS